MLGYHDLKILLHNHNGMKLIWSTETAWVHFYDQYMSERDRDIWYAIEKLGHRSNMDTDNLNVNFHATLVNTNSDAMFGKLVYRTKPI
jgi:hypothetical protein